MDKLQIVIGAVLDRQRSEMEIRKTLRQIESQLVSPLQVKLTLDTTGLDAQLARLRSQWQATMQQMGANMAPATQLNTKLKESVDLLAQQSRAETAIQERQAHRVNVLRQTQQYQEGILQKMQSVVRLEDGSVSTRTNFANPDAPVLETISKNYEKLEKDEKAYARRVIEMENRIADAKRQAIEKVDGLRNKVDVARMARQTELRFAEGKGDLSKERIQSLSRELSLMQQMAASRKKEEVQVQKQLADAKKLEQVRLGMLGNVDQLRLSRLNELNSDRFREIYAKRLSGLSGMVPNLGQGFGEAEVARFQKQAATLDALGKRYKEVERNVRSLQKAQQEAQVYTTNLLRRYGEDGVDAKGLNAQLDAMKRLNPMARNFTTGLQEVQTNLKMVGAQAKSSGSHIMSFGNMFKTAMLRFPVWMAATTAFYGTIRAIQAGVQEVYQLDTAMTNLRKVTSATSLEYEQFTRRANQTASEIGSSTVAVINATTEWARLGYSMRQSEMLARESMILANVGDMTAEEASKALISAMKGFGIAADLEGKNIRRVVDIYNEVGNNFAVSSAGIAEALRRSASSLSAAGNTIEQSVALVTAANSTIQDPVRVGTALKTVSMRIRGISDEGEDLSDLVPTLEKKFASLGLTLKKDNQTFKSTYEIFSDLAAIWNTGQMSDFQKAEITELVAGKLQGNIVASLLENFADAQGSLESAVASAGSAARENEKQLDSLKGKVAQLKNEFTEMSMQMISTDFLKDMVDAGTFLMQAANDYSKISIAVIKNTSQMKEIEATYKLVSYIVQKMQSLTKIQTVSPEFIAKSEVDKAQIKELKALQVEYEELSSQQQLTTQELERMKQIEIELVSVYGIKETGINSQGQAYAKGNAVIAERIRLLEEERLAELKKEQDKLKNYSYFSKMNNPFYLIYLQSGFSSESAKKKVEDGYAGLREFFINEMEIMQSEGVEPLSHEMTTLLLEMTRFFDGSLAKNPEDAVTQFRELYDALLKIGELTPESLPKIVEMVTGDFAFTDRVKVLMDEFLVKLISARNETKKLSNEADGYAAKMTEFNVSMKEQLDHLSTLEGLWADAADGKALSGMEMLKMLETSNDLVSVMELENGQIKLNQQAIKDKFETEKAILIKTTEMKIDAINEEIKKLKELEEERAKQNASSLLYSMTLPYLLQSGKDDREQKEFEKRKEELEKKLGFLQSLTLTIPKSSGASSGPDTLSQPLDRFERFGALVSSLRDEAEARMKNVELLKEKIELAEREENQVRAAELMAIQLKEQHLAVEALLGANEKLTKKASEVRSLFMNMGSLSFQELVREIDAVGIRFSHLPEDMQKALKGMNLNVNTDEWFDSSLNASLVFQELIDGLSRKSQEVYRNQKLSVQQRNVEIERIKMQIDILQDVFSALRELKSGWKENKDAVEDLSKEIKEIPKSFEDATKEAMESFIDAYEKGIEALMDVEEDRHDQAVKHLKDEKDRFMEIVDEKLKMLDRENATEDFEQEYQKKLQERGKLLNEIRLQELIGDLNAKAEKKRLTEELAKLDEDLADLTKQRTRDVIKDNLEDMKDAKEKEIETKLDAEDEVYEKTKRRLEMQLKDEQFYARLRNQMTNEQVLTIQNAYRSLMDELGMKGTAISTLLGDSFRNNLLKELDAALLKLAQLGQAQGIDTSKLMPKGGGSGGSGGGSQVSPSRGDSQLTWQEKLAKASVDVEYAKAEILRAKQVYAQKKAMGDEAGMKAAHLYANQIRERQPSLNEDKLFQAKSGGLLPSFSGGKFLLAHEKELVLNAMDTKNLLKMVDIGRNAMQWMKGPELPSAAKASDLQSVTPSITIQNLMPIAKVDSNTNVESLMDRAIRKMESMTGMRLRTV